MFTFVLNETERKPPNSLTLTHMYNRIHVHGIDIQMECTYKYMQMDDGANEILNGHGGGVQIQRVSIYVEYVS